METSDSECFESADESFNSDDETKVNNIKKSEGKLTIINSKNICDQEAAVKNDDNIQVECLSKEKILKEENKEKSLNKNNERKQTTNNTEKKQKENIKIKDSLKTKNEPIQVNDSEKDKKNNKIEPLQKFRVQPDTDKEQNDIKLEVKSKKESDDENLWDDNEDWNLAKTEAKTEIQADITEKNMKKLSIIDNNPKQFKNVENKNVPEPDENLWNDDEGWGFDNSDNEEKSIKTLVQTKQPDDISKNDNSWQSWGSWGVSSILNTATHGVTSLTSHVSQGLSTVMETAPETENNKINKNLPQNDDPKANPMDFSFFVSRVSNLTKLVESTGTKVISGGLDTLETIGKKTMEVLQDGDPGLKKKRAFLNLGQKKTVLSQVLREAKEKAEFENNEKDEYLSQRRNERKVNYEMIFDDNQGLVHLEALEMLSKQCEIKLNSLRESLSGDALIDMQETLDQVKELCEVPEENEDDEVSIEDVKERLENSVKEMGVNITYDGLYSTWEKMQVKLNELDVSGGDERDIHAMAIEKLAQLTAVAVEQFHKAGELLLVKDYRSTADEADSLVQITTAITSLIGVAAVNFSNKLNVKALDTSNKEVINGLITNIFFEAANSSSYVQDGLQLLLPILQVGAVS